jgi:hypothetical protein
MKLRAKDGMRGAVLQEGGVGGVTSEQDFAR